MGCFNTVTFRCPACAHLNETQSKGGDCSMSRVPLQAASVGDLAYIVDEVHTCSNCGDVFEIIVQTMVNVCSISTGEDEGG